MKLPIPFLEKKRVPFEYYLALLLTDEKAAAVILQEAEGKIQIIGRHEEDLPSSLEMISLEELITLIDKTISRAEEVLPPDIETHKAVFGLKQDWIEEETKKIKKEHLGKLKKVCDSLDLSPIGFMVLTEAVAHFLKQEEGAPLSAIFAEIGNRRVALTLLRGGKIIETVEGKLDKFSASATVDTLLKHFTVPVLPARIIIFPTDQEEELSQQFIRHQWSKSLPFQHIPQVSVLPQGFDAKAVTFGAATQMGFEMVGMTEEDAPRDILMHEPDEEEKEEVKEETEEELDNEILGPKEEEGPSEFNSAEEEAPEENTEEDFGFVINGDVEKIKPKTVIKKPEQKEEDTPPVHHIRSAPSEEINYDLEEELEIEKEQEELLPGPEKSRMKLPAFPKFRAMIPRLNLHLPQLGDLGGRKGLIILAVILLFLGGLGSLVFFGYMNKVKTTVVLSVKPKMVKEDLPVTFSSTSPSDFSEKIIAAKNVEVSVDGEASGDATGKKDVGEKAKGTVTIYSNLPQSKTFSSGTVIVSNGQAFTLDKDVTAASSSGDVGDYSKTSVPVTAKEIGTDSNLPSGGKFTVGDYDTSDVVAKNDSAFSGGSKKTVTVVSKDDIAKLRKDLIKSLEDKARESIIQKVSGDETMIPYIQYVGVEKETTDKKAGDEAKKVKITVTLNYQGYAYKNDEVTSFTQALLKSKYSQDISFADKTVKTEIIDVKLNKDEDIEGTLKAEGGLLPNIDKDGVIRDLHKKSLKQARETLNTLPQVSGIDIRFSPALPFLPDLFPHLPNNISVLVEANE